MFFCTNTFPKQRFPSYSLSFTRQAIVINRILPNIFSYKNLRQLSILLHSRQTKQKVHRLSCSPQNRVPTFLSSIFTSRPLYQPAKSKTVKTKFSSLGFNFISVYFLTFILFYFYSLTDSNSGGKNLMLSIFYSTNPFS